MEVPSNDNINDAEACCKSFVSKGEEFLEILPCIRLWWMLPNFQVCKHFQFC